MDRHEFWRLLDESTKAHDLRIEQAIKKFAAVRKASIARHERERIAIKNRYKKDTQK